MTDLTDEERRAIRALRRLEKIWPRSLWLFSASGSLRVMKNGDDGERLMTHGGGVDPNGVVEKIDIPSDGGDW